MTSFSRLTTRKMPLSPQFLEMVRRVVLWLAACFVLFQFAFVLPEQLNRSSSGLSGDLNIYFRAAVRLKQGLDVYQPWPDYTAGMIPNRFFYPPPFLLLTRPLVELGFQNFARVWILLIVAAYWIYAACLAKLATGHWNWKATLIFGMIISIAFRGDEALFVGQFEPFIWMMLGLALATKQRAGWLTLATLVKIYPLWSLCLVLHKDKSRAWRQMLLFALPALLASLWLVGAHNWSMWWPSTSTVASQGTFSRFNWSFSFYALRLAHYAGWLQVKPALPLAAKAFLSLCAVGAPLVMALATRKASDNLQLALVISASVLFAPLCWMVYYPILLLPVAVYLGERHGRSLEKAF